MHASLYYEYGMMLCINNYNYNSQWYDYKLVLVLLVVLVLYMQDDSYTTYNIHITGLES